MNQVEKAGSKVRIWGHRGCSRYMPENTIPAFLACAKLPGITGIEFDVHLSKDGELVVIHDETLERTTLETGAVGDYRLEELRRIPLRIKEEDRAVGRFFSEDYHIPSLRELFDAMAPFCREKGLLLNIELKTSVVRYPGIEQKTFDCVKEYGLEQYIVYSSFLPDSVRIMKEIDPKVKTGMLADALADCIRMGDEIGADAYHPDITKLEGWEGVKGNGKEIRAWNCQEPLYNTPRPDVPHDYLATQAQGVTDIIVNSPEEYLLPV
jgi:glycerophosphoryl diester phosphodiesterase